MLRPEWFDDTVIQILIDRVTTGINQNRTVFLCHEAALFCPHNKYRTMRVILEEAGIVYSGTFRMIADPEEEDLRTTGNERRLIWLTAQLASPTIVLASSLPCFTDYKEI